LLGRLCVPPADRAEPTSARPANLNGKAIMSNPIVFGFPRSTYVNIVRLVLTHKEVAYTFQDLETEMGKPSHLALHPFNRVPILRHGDFTVYETSAIVGYLEETFPTPALQPKSVRDRARMNQWISTVNSYYYPYMIYHVSHERNVFPELGIAADETVVAHALPKIEVALQVAERELAHGKDYLLGPELSLADYYLLPCTYSFSFAPEAKTIYPKYPAFSRWRETMEDLPAVKKLRAGLPPRAPIEHAREWAVSHRPKY
jgi:glutathione S-transferase